MNSQIDPHDTDRSERRAPNAPATAPRPSNALSNAEHPAVQTTDFSRRPFGRCGLLPPAPAGRLGRTG